VRVLDVVGGIVLVVLETETVVNRGSNVSPGQSKLGCFLLIFRRVYPVSATTGFEPANLESIVYCSTNCTSEIGPDVLRLSS